MSLVSWSIDTINLPSSVDSKMKATIIGVINKNYVTGSSLHEVEQIYCELNNALRLCSYDIKKVIFNPPATIILWKDETKTVVKCQNGEEFDPEKGFALAYLKKMLGNDNTFNKEIHKWVVVEDTNAE